MLRTAYHSPAPSPPLPHFSHKLYGHFKLTWDYLFWKAPYPWEIDLFKRWRSPLKALGTQLWFISQSEGTRALIACILRTREMQLKNKLPEQLMSNDIILLISLERNLGSKEETECVFLQKQQQQPAKGAAAWWAVPGRGRPCEAQSPRWSSRVAGCNATTPVFLSKSYAPAAPAWLNVSFPYK